LLDFLHGDLWQPPNWRGFEIHEVDTLPASDVALVAIPARHHAGREDRINDELAKIKHVVLFLLGDEEAEFAVEKLTHRYIHIWVQNPHPGRHDGDFKFGTGYPPQSQTILPKLSPVKDTDLFFSGQITHKRRTEMLANIREYQAQGNDADVTATQGFTQGLSHVDYYRRMARAKVAPAPSGAVIPDSFRLYEALEAMCIPLADERDPHGKIDGYWDWLFGEECPFYKVREWDNLVGWTQEAVAGYPMNVHRQTAWWINWKRQFAYKVMEQLNA
jgi:hypothetical protein